MKLLIPLLILLASLHSAFAQVGKVTISGKITDKTTHSALPYVNVVIVKAADSLFIAGTITGESGQYTIPGIVPGNYVLRASLMGYKPVHTPILIGKLSEFLDLGDLALQENAVALQTVTVTANNDAVAETMDKKTFTISENVAQTGGSLLQVMQNLPGVTVSEEGTLKIRGSDKVAVLIDGKQTALTGFEVNARSIIFPRRQSNASK